MRLTSIDRVPVAISVVGSFVPTRWIVGRAIGVAGAVILAATPPRRRGTE